ncbi:MAG: EpsG family protein [Bacteroidales bacterium]
MNVQGNKKPVTGFHPTITWFAAWLIWPFGALAAALKNYRAAGAQFVFWLFCMYFGFVFVFPDTIQGSADSARYAQKLVEMHEKALSFHTLIKTFYNEEEGIVDFYQPLATWLVAVFTSDPKWLYALFGAVFGIFYVKNIWFLLTRLNHKTRFFLLLLLLAFALTNPIWNINGARMWTAAQVFLYGGLSYYLEQKKSGFFWMAASALFHFSFILPIVSIFIFSLLPKNITIFFFFYILTAFVTEIDIKTVRDAISFVPDFFQKRIDSYTNPDYIAKIQEATEYNSWHVNFAALSLRIVLYTLTIIAYAQSRYWKPGNNSIRQIFMLALFLGGFANLTSHLPSGGRFVTIANGFFFAAFVLIFQHKFLLKKNRLVRIILIPLLSFWLIFAVRVGFDYTGFMTVFGNPLMAVSGIEQRPLITFVKSLF